MSPKPRCNNCGVQVASFIELQADAVANNARVLRALAAPAQLGAVIKGNAYGHGFREMLPLVHAAADALYVIDVDDALAVRRWEDGAPQKPVLVLGALTADEAVACARAGIDATVADASAADWAPALRKAGARLRVHVHVDTGLSREGFTVDRLPDDVRFLDEPCFDVRGALSHFANTEDVTEQGFAIEQLRAFDEGVRRLGRTGLQRHFAASAAAMVLPPSRFDRVRAGIALYGLWPSTETRLSTRVLLGSVPELRPVLSWRCPSQLVKTIPAGAYVGYGCTYRCPSETRIAVLPVGYSDGYPRLLSGRAHALVNGQRCPVLGRVMMNHVVIDVTRAAPGADRVTATLLGKDGAETLAADQLAAWAQTINYELVTRLGSHLSRRVV